MTIKDTSLIEPEGSFETAAPVLVRKKLPSESPESAKSPAPTLATPGVSSAMFARDGGRGVEAVYSLLGGDVVLLPLPRGRKGCMRKGWTKVTLSETKSPEYQDALAVGDLAVLLGQAGNGICTIDCDVDEAGASLLAANPLLKGTLRTRGARGCNFWVRIIGEIPKSGPLYSNGEKVGEWRADGNATKIAGTHPDTGEQYQWLVAAPPLEVAFDQIVWPDDWSGACIKSDFDRLVDKFGIPYSPTKTSIQLNQTFFAGKFAFENAVLFETAENRFYLYDEARGLWQHTTEAKIKTLLLADLLDFSKNQDAKIKNRFELARTDQYAGNVARVLRGQVERRGVFSNPRRIVHVLNGVVEIGGNGVTLRPFSPTYYSRNQVPVLFEPAARCPRFLDQLLGQALSADDIYLVQKWTGGVLLGGNLAQKMLIQDGGAGTGKGTTADIIGRLVGADNVTQLRTELLHERFEIARFVGKKLLAGRDVPGDFLNRRGASVIKALTGADVLDTEIKGSMTAPTVSCMDILITSNSRLRVRLEDDAGAWRRRLLIVRYSSAPPAKPIADFADKLFCEEGSGILNWALAGAVALHGDLEVHGRFQVTVAQQKRVDDLLAESDSVRAFLSGWVVRHEEAEVTTNELCEKYSRYCENMEWRPLSRREVERTLPDLMLEVFNLSQRHDIKQYGKSYRGYSGIQLRQETNDHAA